MFNRIILIGNLTQDVSMAYLPSGIPVGTLRIAVNTRYKSGNDTKEETLFIDVITFGKTAESCKEFLSKGSPVLVEGRLRERRWESEGAQRSKFEVIASSVRFLSKRGPRQDVVVETPEPEEVTEAEPF